MTERTALPAIRTDSTSPRFVYVQTYGCQMNEYDSKRMLDLLKKDGHFLPVDAPEQADLVLLNTCSIREKAEEKVFSALGRLRKLKQKNPRLLIGVGGCVASQEGQSIQQRAPFVDIIFGPQTLHRLPSLIEAAVSTQKTAIDVTFPEIEKFDRLPAPSVEGISAAVSVMEGCSKFCSYCIVPFTRGPEVSRPVESVLEEVLSIAERGVREVTLLGQNVNAYQGLLEGREVDLAALIECVAAIPGVQRIRFMTSHPTEFSDRLVEVYATVQQLVSHLHLPVQSGSNRILRQMKRGYTRETYIEKITKLRAVRPGITLTSDFIVGYPGETEADFEETLDLVQSVGFDQSYSFIYSKRPGTPAAELSGEVPLEVKKERLMRLQALLNQQSQQMAEQLLGTSQPVLLEGPSKKDSDSFSGRTEGNRLVHVKGELADRVGHILNVKITEVLFNSLRGIVF